VRIFRAMTGLRPRWGLRAAMASVAAVAVLLAWYGRGVPVTVVNQTRASVTGAWLESRWGRIAVPPLQPGQSCSLTLPPWSWKDRHLMLWLTVPQWGAKGQAIQFKSMVHGCVNLRLTLTESSIGSGSPLQAVLDFTSAPGAREVLGQLLQARRPAPPTDWSFTLGTRAFQDVSLIPREW
jgi:hypothetical protein